MKFHIKEINRFVCIKVFRMVLKIRFEENFKLRPVYTSLSENDNLDQAPKNKLISNFLLIQQLEFMLVNNGIVVILSIFLKVIKIA